MYLFCLNSRNSRDFLHKSCIFHMLFSLLVIIKVYKKLYRLHLNLSIET